MRAFFVAFSADYYMRYRNLGVDNGGTSTQRGASSVTPGFSSKFRS